MSNILNVATYYLYLTVVYSSTHISLSWRNHFRMTNSFRVYSEGQPAPITVTERLPRLNARKIVKKTLRDKEKTKAMLLTVNPIFFVYWSLYYRILFMTSQWFQKTRLSLRPRHDLYKTRL